MYVCVCEVMGGADWGNSELTTLYTHTKTQDIEKEARHTVGANHQ